MAPSKNCAVCGCTNNKVVNPGKHFFWSPRNLAQKGLWMLAVGKVVSENTSFLVCEDHFDVSFDVFVAKTLSTKIYDSLVS